MAIYRQLHTTFGKTNESVNGAKIKNFFLYLLSNDYTTQCGVYEFNLRYAKFELDMTAEEIKQTLTSSLAKAESSLMKSRKS